ncbi:MAG: regulatory iron-sulfur-containing complex subunit RicT [Anaerolineae bacterium]|nr:regulatory iron-sulfur-containing complex subunit RicT [Anaerolineae bacterium]
METAPKEPSMFDLPEWTGLYPPEEKPPEPKPRLVGVRFQRVGKIYHYSAEGFDDLKVGDWVIVDTARGKQMGQVATLKPPKDKGGPYKRIERRATGRDMAMRHYYESKELEAMIACRAESAALNLPIKIVRAEYSFDGQTLTFLYSSDQEERVEVGALREAMSRLYRARIETRQISPREVAKILGGMGACGIEERCCSRFLTEFSPISIKHAKEQNLSLNPHDITGMCGRLRCCLIYEYEQYVEARRHLPKLKSMIGTPLGPGKVIEILHLRDSVRVKIGEGPEAREVEFHREQLIPLEEWKRLQEKAASGTCDRHENGECNCGKGKQGEVGAAGQAQPQEHALPPAAQAFIAANEAQQAQEEAARPARAKKKKRKRGDERRATDVGRHQPPAADADGDPVGKSKSAKSKRRPLLRRKSGK